MVLGEDLMSHLGHITFDFRMHNVEFQKDGKTIFLQGISEEKMQFSMITWKQLKKMVKRSQCEGQAFLCIINAEIEVCKCKAIPELEPLLEEYISIFQMSISLPHIQGWTILSS